MISLAEGNIQVCDVISYALHLFDVCTWSSQRQRTSSRKSKNSHVVNCSEFDFSFFVQWFVCLIYYVSMFSYKHSNNISGVKNIIQIMIMKLFLDKKQRNLIIWHKKKVKGDLGNNGLSIHQLVVSVLRIHTPNIVNLHKLFLLKFICS